VAGYAAQARVVKSSIQAVVGNQVATEHGAPVAVETVGAPGWFVERVNVEQCLSGPLIGGKKGAAGFFVAVEFRIGRDQGAFELRDRFQHVFFGNYFRTESLLKFF